MKRRRAIVLVVVLTVLGTLLYLRLTRDRDSIDIKIEIDYGVDDEQFAREMGALLGPPLVPGNSVVAMLNGDEIFPAMLAAIREAKRSICFETYIYWSGEIGREFATALSERADAGVKVHVLLDWVGGNVEQGVLDEMKVHGVQVERYQPVHWYNLTKFNNRTHRKILVTDGCVGFTGGVGIGDPWQGSGQDKDHWRDTHFRLEGPAVAQMQGAFMANWVKTRAEVLHGEDYFPPLESKGDVRAQVFNSSPRAGAENMRLMYLLSIAAARHSIRLSQAYFVPDDLALRMLVDACKRGVKIEVILPGEISDDRVVQRASRSRWGDLMEAGAVFYRYSPTFYHTKMMIVDDLWVSVGSTNFDERSFRLNDEMNLNVLDASFAKRQVEIFEQDKQASRCMTLDEWRERPWTERAVDWFAGLLRKQL